MTSLTANAARAQLTASADPSAELTVPATALARLVTQRRPGAGVGHRDDCGGGGMSAQITVRFSVTGPETVEGLLGRPVEVVVTRYGGDDPLICITYFGEQTAECPHNNVTFYRDGLPTYAADHLAEAKRITAEWSQS